MAWTAPRTWAVSEVVTAAIMNTYIRDNQLYLKTDIDTINASSYPSILDNEIYVVPATNVGVAETVLSAFTVLADTLDTNGLLLRVMWSGYLAATANNKVMRVYFGGVGGTKLWDSGAMVLNGDNWQIEMQISRVGVGSQYATVGTLFGQPAPAAKQQAQERQSAAEDETANLDVTLTGQSSVGGGEITANQILVELL